MLGSTLSERPPGGLGLHLVRSFADDVAYERSGSSNRFRMQVLRPEVAG